MASQKAVVYQSNEFKESAVDSDEISPPVLPSAASLGTDVYITPVGGLVAVNSGAQGHANRSALGDQEILVALKALCPSSQHAAN